MDGAEVKSHEEEAGVENFPPPGRATGGLTGHIGRGIGRGRRKVGERGDLERGVRGGIVEGYSEGSGREGDGERVGREGDGGGSGEGGVHGNHNERLLDMWGRLQVRRGLGGGGRGGEVGM